MARITTEGRRTAVAFSPDGRRLAVGSDGAVTVWDWENQQPALPPLRGHAKKGISVAFSRDGRRLASGSWSGEVMIWDAETGKRLLTLSEHRHPVSAVAFSRDGRRLVSACFDRHMVAWDVTTGRRLQTFGPCDGLVLGVAISPDGSRLASAGEDKTVRVWEAATGREVLDLRGHTELSQGVAFSPDGLRLASAGGDGTIRVWDATPLRGDEAQEAFTFSQGAGEVWTMAVSPDGQSIASAGLGSDTPVKVWDAGSGQVTAEFAGHESVVFCVAWHPDGQRIASSGWDVERKLFIVKVWDARTGEVGFELPVGTETYAVAFSRDGEYLVTGSANGTVQVWDARTGRQRRQARHARPARPGVGVQPRRPAFGLGERRRGGQAVGLGRDPPWGRAKASPHFSCPGPHGGHDLRVQPGRPTPGRWGARRIRSRSGTCRPSRCKSSGDTAGTSGPRPSAPTPRAGGSPRRDEDSTVKVWDSPQREVGPQFPRPHRPRQQCRIQPRRPTAVLRESR